eukprot:CAMPEP_0179458396 /NCGR_PEP_ID=MMETSP0799-20121207/41952_1 /TAXON_ID=46947 /ORGANISM="Geminigera cryophila, Strain CCMP2564" /LENGTH=148 /DNA_ID=CAMNT_0021259617 /DNA_START=32 /DNA_END=475 /DNA_ORIENTATION=-
MEVTAQQVRAHLKEMGFDAVPDDVLQELRGELLARMNTASATPTPELPQGKLQRAPAGYEADESEWENRDKENCLENRARANNTKATSGIGGPNDVGHRGVNTPKNSHARSAAARGAEIELKDASVRDKRPVTSPATRSRGVGRGGLG